jgi:hypothetical protein
MFEEHCKKKEDIWHRKTIDKLNTLKQRKNSGSKDLVQCYFEHLFTFNEV